MVLPSLCISLTAGAKVQQETNMWKQVTFLAALAVVASTQQAPLRAIVHLRHPSCANQVRGDITFEQEEGKVHIQGLVSGMPEGAYGFTLHEKGDISNGCANVGDHYNPEMKAHGHPHDEERHAGDLGNIHFDKNNKATVDFRDHKLTLIGKDNFVGRTLVLHSMADDYGHTDHPDSKITGNSGDAVACGVVGYL